MVKHLSSSGGFVGGTVQNICAAIFCAGAYVGVSALSTMAGILKSDADRQLAAAAAALGVFVLTLTILRGARVTRNKLKRWYLSINARSNREKLTIVVARLVRDDDGLLTQRVVLSLREQFGNSIEVIELDVTADDRSSATVELYSRQAKTKAQKLLSISGGDILLFGRVFVEEKVIDLSFLARDTTGLDEPEVYSYALNEVMRLPTDFGTDLGTAIAGYASSASAIVLKSFAGDILPIVEPVAVKLKSVIGTGGAIGSSYDSATLWYSYGLVLSVIGEQGFSGRQIDEAIEALRSALSLCDKKLFPFRWAEIQNTLACELLAKNHLLSDKSLLEEAIRLLHEVLEVRTPKENFEGWCKSQLNLAGALFRYGSLAEEIEQTAEAIHLFEDVLERSSRLGNNSTLKRAERALAEALWIKGVAEDSEAERERALSIVFNSANRETRSNVTSWCISKLTLSSFLYRKTAADYSNTQPLEVAIELLGEVLAVPPKELEQALFFNAKRQMAGSLSLRGWLKRSILDLDESIELLEDVLRSSILKGRPAHESTNRLELGITLVRAAVVTHRTERIDDAVIEFDKARTYAKEKLEAGAYARFLVTYGQKLLQCGVGSKNELLFMKGADALEEAAAINSEELDRDQWLSGRMVLAQLLTAWSLMFYRPAEYHRAIELYQLGVIKYTESGHLRSARTAKKNLSTLAKRIQARPPRPSAAKGEYSSD